MLVKLGVLAPEFSRQKSSHPSHKDTSYHVAEEVKVPNHDDSYPCVHSSRLTIFRPSRRRNILNLKAR